MDLVGQYKVESWSGVPPEQFGLYASADTVANERLYEYIESRRYDAPVWQVELDTTKALFRMERNGMRVDPEQLEIKRVQLLYAMAKLEMRIDEMVGNSFNPSSNDDCYDYFCTKKGLPALGYTEKGEPSFNADVMRAYAKRDPSLAEVCCRILEYRDKKTTLNMFVEPYLELHVDGVLHPDYNQSVKTGRNACRRPNAQQLSNRDEVKIGEWSYVGETAKDFILPSKPGHRLYGWDASQIEFRLIVHYINSAECIKAYLENPDTDFHKWVAEMCGIDRSPAKVLNFALGYGAGRKKVLKMLETNPKLIGENRAALAAEVYEKYFETLYTLRPTMRQAEATLLKRGYVYDAYGRRRHLPAKQAYRAFNTVCQGSAASIMKDRVSSLDPSIMTVAVVHDELLVSAPDDFEPTLVTEHLEKPIVNFRVPIRWNYKGSGLNWAGLGAA
jgi:DNA polymerase-1